MMDSSYDGSKSCLIDQTLGSLFQQILNDMKNASPLWEELIFKASKLHASLRTVVQAFSTFLEVFQKIADLATYSKGSSKDIGTALTRVCLRHKAVETRLKTLTNAIMDSMIVPLQEKIEEWKKETVNLDKERTKEFKKCRNELKKRSNDTLKLQKKAKRGTMENIKSLVDVSVLNVNQQKAELMEIERNFLRSAMLEDRGRFCSFINSLRPVVKEEYEMMYEIGHLQEAMQTVNNITQNTTVLPQTYEELIYELKPSYNSYLDSPTHSNNQICGSSIGSRKNSICSISSLNSNGSYESLPVIQTKPKELAADATQAMKNYDRPHTISAVYERGHQRLSLTQQTFQLPGNQVQNSPKKPPIPLRCSSLERQPNYPETKSGAESPRSNLDQNPTTEVDMGRKMSAAETSESEAHKLNFEALSQALNSASPILRKTHVEYSSHETTPKITSPLNMSTSLKNNEETTTNSSSFDANESFKSSPIIDQKSIGSVLDKASMFEKKLEKREHVIAHPTTVSHINHTINLSRETVARLESIYGKRTEEALNRIEKPDSETGIIQQIDSLELESIIGDLVSYQCEHDFQDKINSEAKCKNTNGEHRPMFEEKLSEKIYNHPESNCTASSLHRFYDFYNNEMLDIDKNSYSESRAGDFPEPNNTLFNLADTGYENPSFQHLNESKNGRNSAEIVILRNKYSGSQQDLSVLDGKEQRTSTFKLRNQEDSNKGYENRGGFGMQNQTQNTNEIFNSDVIMNKIKKLHSYSMYSQQPDEPVSSSAEFSFCKKYSTQTPNSPKSMINNYGTISRARRSSVNTVKPPPPPVRRSSSVTASGFDKMDPNRSSDLVDPQMYGFSSSDVYSSSKPPIAQKPTNLYGNIGNIDSSSEAILSDFEKLALAFNTALRTAEEPVEEKRQDMFAIYDGCSNNYNDDSYRYKEQPDYNTLYGTIPRKSKFNDDDRDKSVSVSSFKSNANRSNQFGKSSQDIRTDKSYSYKDKDDSVSLKFYSSTNPFHPYLSKSSTSTSSSTQPCDTSNNVNVMKVFEDISNFTDNSKATFVRNLINSKVVPDPRDPRVRDSLLNQIKQGATLKHDARN